MVRALIAVALLAATAPVWGATPPAPAPAGTAPEDFTNMELEQLMAMEVTGVTRRAGAYARSPAAIFVLTSEDIHRSGVRTIADALRLVPGLQVTRSGQSYTVTARGFGADKLQVLLDGRSVYTPLTSAVFWDLFDTNLEDIARIEVIRGPGATVWGANAVNGVINIVTKPAADSAGTSLYAGGGNEERAFGGFRSGGRVGDRSHGRAYMRARERDSTQRADGSEIPDGQVHAQVGGRIDSNLGSWGSLTVMGDLYSAKSYSVDFYNGQTTDADANGRNLGLQWNYAWGGGATTQTSLYYDGYDRFIPTIFGEKRDTFDLNVQQNFPNLGDHVLTAGVGARVSRDETAGPPAILVFQPANRTVETYTAFVQDEWALTESLWLIAGTKLENNDFTGFEVQPGVRVGWALTKSYFTWASVSRAVRTPNRIDHDVGITCTGVDTPIQGCGGAGQVLAIGSKDFDSEKLIAYEWGLRSQLTHTLLADIALYYNDYSDLRSSETGLRFANNIEAQGYGGELSTSWEMTRWLGLQGYYSYLKVDADRDPSSSDTTTVNTLENGAPQQQAGLRFAMQPWAWLEVDANARFVDSLAATRVPQYTELDLRVAWLATPFLEFALTGQNLLDSAHPESGANPNTRSELARGGFLSMYWRWK